MYCTQCGTQANDGDRFCASCGTPIAGVPSQPSPLQDPEPARQESGPQLAQQQSKSSSAVQAIRPGAAAFGRKGLKWALRIVGLFVAVFVLLAWKEAAVKGGIESGLMGVFRGLIVFGTYLAFFEWTKSLDPVLLNRETDTPVPRIVGAELAKFVTISALVVVIAYKSAPHNVSPEGVRWASIIGIAIFAVWLWREKDPGHPKD